MMKSNIFINKCSGMYLTYFDKDWSCLFFPNCKGSKDIEENRNMISAYLNSIDFRFYILHCKGEKKITKWNLKKQRYVDYNINIWVLDSMNYYNPKYQYKTMDELEKLDPYGINKDIREIIKEMYL